MFNDDNYGPSMDVNSTKNRAAGNNLTSNNADKLNVREAARPKAGPRRRDHARGGHDVVSAPFASTASDLRRQFKGHKKHVQRQQQLHQHQQLAKDQQQSHYHPCSNDNPAAAQMMMEDEFEVGSVFNPGSKKQNYSHLLKFEFEPRGNSKSKKNHHEGAHRRGTETRRPRYNKEQYLQANCQFVVKNSGDYEVHLADPDTLVNWELIEQVVLKTTSSVPSCPICLYPPRAAKITRCGHVFCWPCILHYLALSDHAWRKCPICYEAIHKPDLKSVISRPWKEFKINDEIEFSLMRRERNSLFALPVQRYFPEVNVKHPNLNDKYTSHSQLVLATPEQVVAGIIAKEKWELEEQYREDKDEPEACFIEEALGYLSIRQSTVKDEIVLSRAPKSPELDDISEEEVNEEYEEIKTRHASSSSDGTQESFEDNSEDQVTYEDLDINPKNIRKETFYFYQSEDGQPIYMHALNVQMLVHEYGSLEQCPLKIKGKIMEKDNTSMTEELRNRLRYLRHLPLTSTFEVCEIAMRPSLISQETLNEFWPQIEARRKKRSRRAREERKREKWIMDEENKRMGKFPDLKCRIESAFHFPEVGAVAIPSSSSARSVTPSNFGTSYDSTLSSPPVGDHGRASDEGFSFAKMLKDGVAKPQAFLPKSTTFPALKPLTKNEDSEPEPEDYVPPPPKASLGDALALAFAQATTISSGPAPGSSKKKSKKMKGQKISLTGSARPVMD